MIQINWAKSAMPRLRVISYLLALVMSYVTGGLNSCTAAERADAVTTRVTRGDVVAFVGGGDVAAAQFTGHLEALFAVQYAGLAVRCRNFGWEGDTVFAQPRDVGFPPLKVHLQRAGATVIFMQYGRSEALSGEAHLPRFMEAYDRMIGELSNVTSRIVLVTPPPFEKAGEYLPDMSMHNTALARYSREIAALAKRRGFAVVDLFTELGGAGRHVEPLTSDGLQFTPRGHGMLALAFARAAGFSHVPRTANELNAEGQWRESRLEELRQAVLAKDRLWFNYWRPQNWAFLGGDRTEQPSSRDYRNPSIRWFPSEMEQYVPMIREADARIQEFAQSVK